MDTFHLSRFVDAQCHTYEDALAEVQRGRKTSHWMWFIFPQLKCLGYSDTARYYGISGLEEAKAYMEHPVLKERLIQITEAVLLHPDKSAEEMFGFIDAKKLRSCMTLFREAAPEISVFDRVLQVFYDSEPDGCTLDQL